jgi:hypothetical protein
VPLSAGCPVGVQNPDNPGRCATLQGNHPEYFIIRIMIIALTWYGPRGVDSCTLVQTSPFSRITCTLQRLRLVVWPRIVITLTKPVGYSKRCRDDLLMPPNLYSGLLPCTSWRTDQNFPKFRDRTRKKEGKFLKECTLMTALV